MNEKKSPLIASMNSGAITGIILIIYALILYFIGAASSKTAGYFNILILAACIFFSSKMYRDKEKGGIISYGQSLGFGTLVGLFASIILAFFVYIELKIIDPGLIDKQMDIAREQALNRGASEEQFEKGMEMMKWMMTPTFSAIMTILFSTFFNAWVT